MTLRSTLRYEPVELQFGTSGRRGKVADLTQLEVYLNAAAELEYLQSLDRSRGGIVRGGEFFFARDLRPRSHRPS
jgi:phosphomannomutase